ncbi:MAG: ATP-binding protein [Candidatus Aenigmatarchaeota archaeon]
MFDKEFVLEYFNVLKERIEKEKIFERELNISFVKNKVVSLIGPRRAGKTYYLLNMFRKNNDCIYMDLEHSAFQKIEHKDLFEIIALFSEYFRKKIRKVILDEVQNIAEWERVVRSLLDSGYYVLISGSTSKLSSKEIATQLRGRGLSYLLLPLSFREYIYFNGFKITKHFSISEKIKIFRLLKKFVEWGAYPEILIEWNKKEKILKEYFDTILQKDFIERLKKVNVYVAKLVFEFVFQNFSKEISFNKIANFVSSQLKKDVKNIVYDYLEKLPESLNVFFIKKFESKVYERALGRKVYISDVGLTNVLKFSKDIGKRMENIVFLELLRKTNEKPLMEIYYFKDYQQREVDFVIKEGLSIKQLIQVTYASNKDEIDKREIRSLLKASELLKCKDLLIITWDYEDEIKINNKTIKFIPLWKWLLKI